LEGLQLHGLAQLTILDGVGAEKFAEHAWRFADELVRNQTDGRVWCESAECSEHGANSAIYTPWTVRKERFDND
jgi:6-pyruvoyltetrahydropterin/6-carboxytetrahydropterin synthase